MIFNHNTKITGFYVELYYVKTSGKPMNKSFAQQLIFLTKQFSGFNKLYKNA